MIRKHSIEQLPKLFTVITKVFLYPILLTQTPARIWLVNLRRLSLCPSVLARELFIEVISLVYSLLREGFNIKQHLHTRHFMKKKNIYFRCVLGLFITAFDQLWKVLENVFIETFTYHSSSYNYGDFTVLYSRK